MTDGGPVWLVRLVLRLYPARFRKRYAADMEQQFSDSWQDRLGVLSRLRLLSGALVSLTVSAFAERRRSSLDGSIMRVARRGGNEPRKGNRVRTVAGHSSTRCGSFAVSPASRSS